MPVWAAAIAATIGKMAISMLMSLMTESFCKKLVVHSLETIASWTKSDWDNKVVADIKAEWKIDA